MTDINVKLRLTSDTPNSRDFRDAHAGLDDIWYQFSADVDGNILHLGEQ